VVSHLSTTRKTRLSPMLGVLLAITVLYLAREIFIPLSLALLLGFLLSPLVKHLERWHVRRSLAVALVVVSSLAGVGFIGWVVSQQLVDVFNQIPAYKDNIREKLVAVSGGRNSSLNKVKNSVQELGKELSASTQEQPPNPNPADNPPKAVAGQSHPAPIPVQVVEPPATVLQAARAIMGPLIVPLGTALVVIVFTVFMLLHHADLRNRLIRLTAPRELNVMTQALDDATERVSKFLLTQFIVNTTFGLLVAAGLYFIGLPNALLWGVLAGLLRFIPYLGTITGGALPLILALAVFPGWKQPLIVLGLYGSIELVTFNLVEPWAYGARTGISPLAIMVAAVFWTTLWGPVGLILSTPLTVCVVVLGRYVPQLEFLFVLLGDEPAMPPADRFYQRLLAMDQPEAQAIAVEFLKTNDTWALYDGVIVPALAMAEDDRHKGALEAGREEFIVQTITEFVMEVPQISEELAAGNDAAQGRTPANKPLQIVLMPAADQADEMVATMLAQLLEAAGHSVTCLPVDQSRLENQSIAHGVDRPVDVVLISALPPFALLSARSLTKRAHMQYPNAEIVIGLWQFSSDAKKAEERLGKIFPDPVVTSLAGARAHIEAASGAHDPESREGLPVAV
jgi:predicted PurR-regulated permease PerM